MDEDRIRPKTAPPNRLHTAKDVWLR